MSNENKVVLRQIMNDLKAGYRYGVDRSWDFYHNCPYRFPYFSTAICLSEDGEYIRWTHAGSSANKATLKDLEWIITVIFDTTPIDFLREYIRNDKSKLPA